MNTFRSEWRKIISVRMWWGLLLSAMLFTAINAGALVALSGTEIQGQESPALTDPAILRSVYASVGSASALVLVLGILAITSEYRHQTITATVLATPNRGRLMAAKMLANAVIGAVIAVACVVVVVAVLLIGLPFRDHAPVDWLEFAAISAGAVLGFAVYAVLGVGFGSLVRNQIAAVTIGLVWVLLVESLIVAFLPAVGKWLPGGALSGVLQAQSFSAQSYLSVPLATGVLLAYGVLFAAVAARTTLRRDIT